MGSGYTMGRGREARALGAAGRVGRSPLRHPRTGDDRFRTVGRTRSSDGKVVAWEEAWILSFQGPDEPAGGHFDRA